MRQQRDAAAKAEELPCTACRGDDAPHCWARAALPVGETGVTSLLAGKKNSRITACRGDKESHRCLQARQTVTSLPAGETNSHIAACRQDSHITACRGDKESHHCL
eukprot:978954-Pelagomonas_calceolata.AAC.1